MLAGLARYCAVLVALIAVAASAGAQSFHQGKQLVVLVNFDQGGPTDSEARLLARHLARAVGGGPAVIVTNMAGSNGAVAANWLAKAAAPDGLILGYFTGIAALRALADPILSPEVAKLAFVAAGPGFAVAYARTDIGGQIQRPSDILTRRDFWVGGVRSDSDRDLRLRMQLDLLGIRHGYQPGFGGNAELRQAFQRGEIQVLIESYPSYRQSIEPGVVAGGQALPLWIDPFDDGETFTRPPEAAAVPAFTFTDFYRHVRGELPKSELFDTWRLLNQIGTTFQRVLVMAPGAPPAAVEAVRKAVLGLPRDPAFREDALRTVKQVPAYVGDERTAEQFRRVVAPSEAAREIIHRYVMLPGDEATSKAVVPVAPAPVKPAQPGSSAPALPAPPAASNSLQAPAAGSRGGP